MRQATLAAAALALGLALMLAGCGEKKKDRAALTLAARVNNGEVTLKQVNLVMQQQRNLRPDQADAVSRQVLERLIDQTLVLQKAEDDGLERDARVQLQLDAARREVLARAWLDRLVESAPKPGPDDVKRYYAEHPALFAERRVYGLLELSIEATPEQSQALRGRLAGSTQLAEFVEGLKAQGLRFASNQLQRVPEQMPQATLDAVLKLQDGQLLVSTTPGGLQVLVRLGSAPQPLDEEAARPLIERQLLADRKRKLVEERLQELRSKARIEYLGSYAQGARPPAPGASAIELGVDGGTK